MLGYGYLRDKMEENPQQKIFDIVEQEFVATAYKGVNGWKSLRPLLNKWLKEISEHAKSGIKIVPTKKNYFTTQGRPIRSVFIVVEYDDELISLTEEQKASYDFLEEYGLSPKQILKIVSDFDLKTIKSQVREMLVSKKDHYGNKYYGEYQRADHKKINNVPGYIYGIVFGYRGQSTTE